MSTDRDPQQEQDFVALYDADDRKLMQTIVAAKRPGVPRVEEIIHFARQAGYRRLGIAHCVGVQAAAEALDGILADHFEVTRVGCKVGGIKTASLVDGGTGTSCNPVGQAKVLADAGTELNIAMALCLGHDILFGKHSAAPVTTLVVKDRVHAHNPIAALS
ncbi:DUF1847 domain-containing protein [bacterium]|nr:DUF1847 domain-containing protein [bacterium]